MKCKCTLELLTVRCSPAMLQVGQFLPLSMILESQGKFASSDQAPSNPCPYTPLGGWECGLRAGVSRSCPSARLAHQNCPRATLPVGAGTRRGHKCRWQAAVKLSLLGLLAKIKSVVSVLISLISDTTPIGGQDIKPIFVGRRRV